MLLVGAGGANGTYLSGALGFSEDSSPSGTRWNFGSAINYSRILLWILENSILWDNFMATYAKILTDASSNQILPYTRAKLVYMEDNTTAQDTITAQASTSAYGRVKVGSNISVSSGVISVATATTSALGVIKVGSNLSISSGTLSVATGTTSALGVLKVGSNISVSSGTISVSKTNVTNALGFTPASTDTAKFLYHCNLPVASWADASSNTTYTGFSYSQTVTFAADNGGPTILSSKKIGAPMSTKTNSATTNETLQANLNIIAAGLMVCTSTTASEIMVFVKEKPSSDITIYFEAQS